MKVISSILIPTTLSSAIFDKEIVFLPIVTFWVYNISVESCSIGGSV